jgi:hypothetical protein
VTAPIGVVAKTALCGTFEVGAELAVVVANDELGPDAEGRRLPELLRRPLRRWVPRYPDMHDLFGVDVDDEERKDRPEPDVVGLQDIARPLERGCLATR